MEEKCDMNLEIGLKEFFYGLSEEFHDALYQSEHYQEYRLFTELESDSL